jgi:hypothetical protein
VDSLIIILVLVLAVISGVAAVYFFLYALGVFNYLGGKKRNPDAVDKKTLTERLLALNNDTRPYQIVRGEDTDLVAEWKIADAKWYGIFNKNGLKSSYKARLLLDETRRSVRCFEEYGTVTWSAGLNGLLPQIHYQKTFFRGRVLYSKKLAKGYGIKQINPPEAGKVYDFTFNVNEIRGPIINVVEDGGWEWVPVTGQRHATYKQ